MLSVRVDDDDITSNSIGLVPNYVSLVDNSYSSDISLHFIYLTTVILVVKFEYYLKTT